MSFFKASGTSLTKLVLVVHSSVKVTDLATPGVNLAFGSSAECMLKLNKLNINNALSIIFSL
jgi:hypothetical protein